MPHRFTTPIAASLLLLLIGPALSAAMTVIPRPDKGDTILVPAESTLHFHAFDQDGTAKFDGPIEMSGTYYYGANAIDDGQAPEMTLYFMPDKATAAHLPRFKTRGQPDEIYLSNAEAFTREVIPRDQLMRVSKSRSAKYISGHIDIWVDRFEAGIECDAPFFNAHFLSVAHKSMMLAMADLPDVGC
jgi:hypothetical protein